MSDELELIEVTRYTDKYRRFVTPSGQPVDFPDYDEEEVEQAVKDIKALHALWSHARWGDTEISITHTPADSGYERLYSWDESWSVTYEDDHAKKYSGQSGQSLADAIEQMLKELPND